MLPNSRAWKLLCKMYGAVLNEEYRRRYMERAGAGHFVEASARVTRAWRKAAEHKCDPVCCSGISGLHDLLPLERRLLMTGNSIGTATLLALTDNPVGSGLAQASVTDHTNSTTDVNYWAFDALAGDTLTIRVDSTAGTADTFVELRNSADGVLASNNNGGPGTNDMISTYTVPASGRLYVKIGQNSGSGDYQLHIDRGRGLGLESDTDYANDTVAGANPLPLSSSGTTLTSTIAGVVMANENAHADVDTFFIGYLKGGTPVNLGVTLPGGSTLDGRVQLLDSAGNVVADTDGSATDATFSGAAVNPGAYYARVSANSGAGPDASYLLNLSISDTNSPAVTSVTLPAAGSTTPSLIFHFDVNVDEELNPATVVPGAFDMRAAGPDGVFNTPDDVVYAVALAQPYSRGSVIHLIMPESPLRSGQYRFTMSATVTDVVGNTLDGNGDAAGGDSFTRDFTVALPGNDTNLPFAASDDGSLAKANPLAPVADPATPGLLSARGIGFISPADYANWWSDEDWWSFPALAGDRVAVHVDTPNSDLDPNIEIYNSNGNYLGGSDNNGPDSDSYYSYYTVPADGTYYVRIGKYYYSTVSDTYRVGVDVARGINLEADYDYHNNSIANADPVTLTQSGSNRTGSVAGQIMGNEGATADVDSYQLGLLTAGQSVELTLHTPAGSTLSGAVRIVNAAGQVIADQDGNATDGHALVQITADGQYYAQVLGNSGAGPDATYVLDVKVGDLIPPVVTSVNRLPATWAAQSPYQTGIAALNPVAFYQFAEGTGTTLVDSSATGANGTYNTGAAPGAQGVYGPARETAASFSASYATVAANPALNLTSGLAFSLWLNVDSYGSTWTPILYKNGGTGGYNSRTFSLYLNNDGHVHLQTADSSGGQEINTPAGSIQTGRWYNISGVIDRASGQMRLYINGQLLAQGAIRTGSSVSAPAAPLYIGRDLEGSPTFRGRLDDLAIFAPGTVTDAQLLQPFNDSYGKGDLGSTDQLPASWSATFSEKLAPTAQGQPVTFYNGHAYVTLSSRSWADAEAWAEAHGGHLVVIDDAAENSFVYNTFWSQLNGSFWIGATDAGHEGSWTTPAGAALPYTNWNNGEPNNSGGAENWGEMVGGGKWNDISNTTLPAVVELEGADADGDGLPDAYDQFPNDAANGYDLREAGPDATFDTPDDVVYHVYGSYDNNQTVSFQLLDGPMRAGGTYRFRVTSSITDLVGNPLDGNKDSVGGDPFDFFFKTDPLPSGVVYEGQSNDTLATATPLTIVQDPTTPELWYTQQPGFGSIDPANYANWWSENDWWSFVANPGDRINLRTTVPAGSALDPYVGLYDSAGNELATNNSSGPNADDYLTYTVPSTVAPGTTYYARVGKYYYATTPGTYRLSVDLVRGAQAETDYDYNNGSINNANALTLTTAGDKKTATVVGTMVGPEGSTTDNDMFNLGAMTSGNVVELTLRMPAGSSLVPTVRLLDQNGNPVPDADGSATDGHFKATLTSTGTYYAQVYAQSGAGPTGFYVLDVSATDDVPPLQVAVSQLPQQLPQEATYVAQTLAGSPLGFYQFGETSGTTLTDSSGAGRNGTYVGSPTFGAPGAYGPTHGNGVTFDGSTYATVSDPALDLTSGMGFSMWINVDSFGGTWTPLLYKGVGDSYLHRTYSLYLNADGRLNMNTADATNNQTVESPSGQIQLHRWYHVAGFFDRTAGTIRMYVNGQLVAQGNLRTGPAWSAPATPLYVGHDTEGNFNFRGTMDDVAIYAPGMTETTLLRPFRMANNQGDIQSMTQLPASWAVTFNEKLAPTAQTQPVTFYNGHAYTTLSTRSWADAETWAEAHGGHLVVINDAAENAFVFNTYYASLSNFWIGATDQGHEGSWTTPDGTAVPYTNWNGGEPNNSGGAENFAEMLSNAHWNDASAGTRPAVVEFDGTDTDGDGLPDTYDQFPADPSNGYDLREAGPDATFDTPDDVVYKVFGSFDGNQTVNFTLSGGPLPSGLYRFTITPSITDTVGNPLDGNGDGTGGDAYAQVFRVTSLPAGVVYEGQNNDTRQTATPLTLVQDASNPEILYTAQPGFGSIDPANYANWWSDNDWWSFTANPGDRINLRTIVPAGSALDPYVGLYDSNGNELATNNSSGPGAEDYLTYAVPSTVAPGTTYYARVGKYYYATTPGNYEIQVDLVRGAQAETDYDYSNGSINNANGVTLAVTGNQRKATLAGVVMAPEGSTQDSDLFNLGALTGGNVVELNVRLPAGSTLVPVVRILDSNGTPVTDIDGAADGHFKATLVSSGTYYVQVYAQSGAGANAFYIVDATVTDTTPPQVATISRIPVQLPSDSNYNAAVLASNPLAYYRFDETSGATAVVDSSGNAYNGSYTGTSTQNVAGPYGAGHDTALNLLGSGAVSIPGDQFDLRRTVSFSFWMNVDHFTGTWSPILYKGTSSSSQRTFALWVRNDGMIHLPTCDATGQQSADSAPGVIHPGTWQHVAGVVDRDNGFVRIYVDGVLVAQGALRNTDSLGNSNPLLVGDTYEAGNPKPAVTIDDLAIYNTALPQEQLLRPFYLARRQGDTQSTPNLISGFALTTSKIVDAASANNAGNYDLRAAGPDGSFDTGDDVIYTLAPSYDNANTVTFRITNGPMAPGSYRFTVKPTLVDLVANQLDGNGDGAGGDAHVQFFTVNPLPAGLTFEGTGNDTLATATPLPLAESPAGSGYFVGRARGSIDPADYGNWWSDNDWYKLTLSAGDHISLSVDSTDGQLNPYLGLYNSAGNELTTDDDGGPGNNSFLSNYTITTAGTYYARVGKYYYHSVPGDYDLRVDVVRNGTNLESDREYANNSIGAANAITYQVNGTQSTATVAGTLMAGQSGTTDQDYFDLGSIPAGQTVLLSVRLPDGSLLKPIVEIRDSANHVVSIATNPAAAVARADITTTGHYYALILATQGQGEFGQYLLDVAVQPTNSLDFADLTVSSVTPVPDAQSGQLIDVGWTVGNYGAITTPSSSWSDRVVLSSNNVYGDADDIQLGVFNHTGALAVNDTYDATASVRLPVGISGDYYILVATDSTNAVSEFIFESNNVTAMPGTFHVTLTPFADLTVSAVSPPTRIVATEPFTVSWTVTNVGSATTGNGTPGGDVSAWTDRLIVSSDDILGNADDRLIADVPHTGALAAGGTYTGTFTGSLPSGLNLAAGNYRLFVTTDLGDTVYEGANATTNSAESAVVEIVPQRYVDLTPTAVSATPNPDNSGDSLSVTYTVANNGITATAGTWVDRVYLSTDAAFDGTDTLLGTFTRNDAVAAGDSYTKTQSVTLPERISGTYYVIVVTDAGNALYEYTYENNNAGASTALTINQRPEADLTVAPSNTNPASASWSQQVTVSWTVTNTGPGDTRSNFVDRVYLSADSTLDGSDTFLAGVNGSTLAALTGSYTHSATFNVPSNLAPGAYHLLFVTDATSTELEGDETNNLAAADFTIRAADLAVSGVTAGAGSYAWGDNVSLQYSVANGGDGATVSNWTDAVYLSSDTTLDGSDRLLGTRPSSATPYTANPSFATQLNWNLPDGTYYLIVKADVYNQQPETSESNNVAVSGPITFALPSLPDLSIDAASISLAQSSPKSGDPVTLQWTERNTGTAAVNAATYTRVRVTRASDNSVLIDQLLYRSAADNAALTAGGSAARTLNLTLPNGPLGAGTFNVDITADYYNQAFEHNAAGTAESNNTSSGSFSSTLAAYPDLTVSGPTLNPAAPQSGQSVTVNYSLNNAGTAPVTNSFYYLVQVTNTTTNQSLYSRLNYYDASASGPIAAGASKALSDTFTLPDGNLGVGSLQVTVTADYYNQVFEYNPGGTAESNNQGQLTAASSLAQYPDLSVSNVAATSGNVHAGDTVLVTWTLNNSGNKSVAGPFTERVFLATSATATTGDLLASVTFNDTLPAGQSTGRSAVVTIPASAAGARWLVVQTDSASQVYELDETNNFGASATPVNIPLGLSISADRTALTEAGPVANVTVTRNGPTDQALVVNLASTNPGVLMAPPTVTIPAGSSTYTFPVSATDNNLVDGNRSSTLSVSAATGGFTGTSLPFTVADNDAPTLTVQLSPNPISEGEGNGSLHIRVIRNTDATNALTVNLASDDPLRARVPATVTIPAGATQVDVTGDILDNIYIDGLRQIRVTATTTGFTPGTDVTAFLDNDIPNLTLTAEQTTISESGGAYATTGTVTRSFASPIDVYVQLTGASGQLILPTFVKIPAFQTSATFSIGAINDSDVTGDRTVVILARVVDSFTKTPIESGQATLPVKVTEDDGPTLSLTTATPVIREDGTGTLRVRRNTGTGTNLTVNLHSSDTNELTLPATATIPDGADFVDVPFSGVEDNVIDGAKNVTVSVDALGYGGSSAVVTVTDADLPDLAVTSITAPTTGETSQTVTVGYTVTNQGVAPATGSWTDRVYLSNRPVIDVNSLLVREFIRSTDLAAGGSYSQSFQMSLPANVGAAYILVQTDYVDGVAELREGNNVVPTPAITVNPAYSVTVQADKAVYGAGQPVVFTGLATRTAGGPAGNEFVAIHVMIDGSDRTVTAFTASNGTYQATFQPLTTEAGNYTVAAVQPGVPTYSAQASFSIAGMKGPSDSLNLTPDILVTRTGTITNRSSIPITGIHATVLGLVDGLTLTPTVPDSLPANGQISLSYTILATKPDLGHGKVVIRLTSDQGATLDVPVDVNVVPLSASLTTTPGSLDGGMLRGERKVVNFTLTNSGSAASGAITITLPSNTPWMRLISPSTLPSLDPGATATVSLELNPDSTLPLDLYTGQIAINSANGASRGLGYSFRAISNNVGDVQIDVVDDYTFYVDGSPKVAGATVRLTDPIDGHTVAEGTTDSTGYITLPNVPEGAYQLVVFAPSHGTYQSRLDVTPGVTNSKEVFIERQLVTYSWTVVPVDVQDTYKITLQPTFETNVPVPVVTVSEPLVMPLVVEDQWTQFNITLTNHGLIAAKGVQIQLPTSPYFELKTLVDDIGDIPAKTTIQVPVAIRGKTGAVANQQAVADLEQSLRNSGALGANQALNSNCLEVGPDIPCVPKLDIQTVYYFECGGDNRYHAVPVDIEPVCVAKSIYDCLKQALGTAEESLPSLEGNLANAPCALIDLILQCADTGLSDCQKALIKAACRGITGAVTGGVAGAAAGVAGAAGDLLSCLCSLLDLLPPLDLGDVTLTGGFSGGGWGGGYANPYGGGIGGSFTTSGCSPSPSSTSTGGANSVTLLNPNSDSAGVCAKVTLNVEQEAVLTRTGFAGTFTLENGTAADTLSGIRVDLDIRDSKGNPANDKFGFRDPDVTGMGDVSGTGVLAGGQTGTARYLFVPTRDAAPTTAQVYHIGGTLTYIDNGVTVTVPLIPATITVHPDPVLTLDYFLQRDVYSDDPFTAPVEPSEPFTLGMIVNNSGAGNARNFNVTSAQPTIIDNEKGLLIDFKIIGTQVSGNDVSPSLTANFGNVLAGTSESARWLMTSTLQGHFIDYKASFTHVDDFGNPRTSLVDAVNFHELEHAMRINLPNQGFADDGMFDFLANDIPDDAKLPDMVYFSGGGKAAVQPYTNGVVDNAVTTSNLTVHMTTAGVSGTGWSYFVVPDPGQGFVLKDVIRSDGTHLKPGDQAWTTDRTFGKEGKVTYNYQLHILDLASTGSYTLVYGKPDEVAPTVTSLGPVTPQTRNTQVDSVAVAFSEKLAAGSFDVSDLSLTRDGAPVSLVGVTIAAVDDTHYTIDGLGALTGTAGNYVLSLNASGISDLWANAGSGATTASWTTVPNVPVVNSVGAGLRSITNTGVDQVTVSFSKAIDPASFDLADLTLTRNGVAVPLAGPAHITQLSATDFRVDALSGFDAADGSYSLSVDATGVTDTSANAGAGSAAITWTVDTTPPTITSLETLATNPRNIAVLSLDVEFSKPIDTSTLTADDVTLTRNGGADLFNSGLTFTQLSPTKLRLSGFTSVTGQQGTYLFTIHGAGITDPAGNAVTNDLSTSWVMDTTAPVAPTNLAISPDNGVSSTDGRTNVLTITLTGTLPESGTTARVVDETTNTILGAATTTGSTFSKTITFAAAGAHHLRVYAVDAAANESPWTYYDVFVDTTVPAVQSITGYGSSTIAIPVGSLTVTFTKAITASSFTTADLSLTRDGAPVDLSGVTITPVDSTHFSINNLTSATTPLGTYVLTVNAAGVSDDAGNTGAGSTGVQWTHAAALASIGDTVFNDANFNGVQDSGELGIGSVTVNLYSDAGTKLATTTTDSSGHYSFDNLDQSLRYFVEFVAPAGFGFTYQNVGNDAADSDPDVSTGRTEVFSVGVGANADWDAGLVQLGSIGGIAYNDINNNHQQDNGEDVLPNFTVFVDLNRNNQPDAGEPTATTGIDGSYRFDNLRPGTYIIAMEVPAGWQQTTPDAQGINISLHSAEVNTAANISSSATPETPTDGFSTAEKLIGLDKLTADPRYSGLTGAGYSVVIIDTGIDLSNPFFGPDANHDGIADRIVYNYDFGSNDAVAQDLSGHGTNIASIVGSSDSTYRGMAPGVNYIVFKVFDDNGNALFGQAEKALQWVTNNAAQYNILAVNMSFGDGRNWDWPASTDCGCGNTVKRETYGLGDELATLRSMNIITAAAAGNNFYEVSGVQGMNYPAADPATISVGAVWDSDRGGSWAFSGTGAVDYSTAADRIAAFSQRQAGYLDVFAPGAIITGAKIGGGVSTMQGTSQATAFVTGAAVLAQELAIQHLGRKLTLAEFRNLLHTTGVTVLDGDDENDNVINTGQAYSRLDVYALANAIMAMSPGTPPTDGAGSTSNDPTQTNTSGQGYAYQISLAPGGSVANASFGLRTANAPQFTLATGPLQDKVVAGYTFHRDYNFTDADAVDSWQIHIDYGDGSAPVNLTSSIRTFSLDHLYTHKGMYTVSVTITDDRGLSTTDTMPFRVIPAITGVRVNGDDGPQRSNVYKVAVDFAEPFADTDSLPTLSLVRRGGGTLPAATVTRDPNNASTLVIDFGGASLPDGIFDLTFIGAGFGPSFASANGSSSNYSFHRLFGDVDGDRDVDNSDLLAFRPVLNTTYTGFNASKIAFDANLDGSILRPDYDAARANLGKTFTYTSVSDYTPTDPTTVAVVASTDASTETLVSGSADPVGTSDTSSTTTDTTTPVTTTTDTSATDTLVSGSAPTIDTTDTTSSPTTTTGASNNQIASTTTQTTTVATTPTVTTTDTITTIDTTSVPTTPSGTDTTSTTNVTTTTPTEPAPPTPISTIPTESTTVTTSTPTDITITTTDPVGTPITVVLTPPPSQPTAPTAPTTAAVPPVVIPVTTVTPVTTTPPTIITTVPPTTPITSHTTLTPPTPTRPTTATPPTPPAPKAITPTAPASHPAATLAPKSKPKSHSATPPKHAAAPTTTHKKTAAPAKPKVTVTAHHAAAAHKTVFSKTPIGKEHK